MTFAMYVLVHSAGSNPFPVLAALRDILGLNNVLEVRTRLTNGPIKLGEWDHSAAWSVAEKLRSLGASVTTETGSVMSYYGTQYIDYLRMDAEQSASY